MTSFKDSEGRLWTLEINHSSMKRVKALTGINLATLFDDNAKGLRELDPITTIDIIFALCQPAAEKREISDEDFGRAMAGDAVEQATDAFLEELVNFSPSRQRGMLTKLLSKSRAALTILRDKGDDALDKMTAEVLANRLSASPGNVPPSSESIPAPSPSAS